MNTKAMIAKLMECSKDDQTHCNNYVTRAELHAILAAGQSPEDKDEEKKRTLGYVMKRFEKLEKRLSDLAKNLEERLEMSCDRYDALEKRVAQLAVESAVNSTAIAAICLEKKDALAVDEPREYCNDCGCVHLLDKHLKKDAPAVDLYGDMAHPNNPKHTNACRCKECDPVNGLDVLPQGGKPEAPAVDPFHSEQFNEKSSCSIERNGGKKMKLMMRRCPECKKENWAMAVASGQCCWCGYKAQPKDIGKDVWECKKEVL